MRAPSLSVTCAEIASRMACHPHPTPPPSPTANATRGHDHLAALRSAQAQRRARANLYFARGLNASAEPCAQASGGRMEGQLGRATLSWGTASISLYRGKAKKRNRKLTLRRGSAAARPPLHTNMNEHINAFIARRLAIPKGVEATVQQSGEAREHGSYAKDIRGTVLRKHVILRMSVGEDAANTTSCPMSDRHAVYGIAKSDVTESPGIFVRSYY